MRRILVSVVVVVLALTTFAIVNPDYESPIVNVVEVAGPAVVRVDVQVKDSFGGLDPLLDEFFRRFFGDIPPREGIGSGFIFDEEGYIMTNDHVVQNATRIQVTLLDGSTYPAEYVGGDSELDIAVIKIDPEEKRLPTIEIGSSSMLRIGEWAIAIGNPLGFQQTVTVGVISAVERQIPKPDASGYYSNLIQTDAAINPGNSGGPLLNIHGKVVGINTALVVPQVGTALGFAIPIDVAMRFVDALIESGVAEKAFLGVYHTTVNENLVRSLNLQTSTGALITDLVPGGPADRAGIRPLDVVKRVDNQDITSAQSLGAAIRNYPPGAAVTVTVNRMGEVLQIEVILGHERELLSEQPPEETFVDDKLGLVVAALTAEDIERLGITREIHGVLVKEVKSGRPASRVGLRADDIITKVSVMGEIFSVESLEDYEFAVESIIKSDHVSLFVARESVTFIASFEYQE